MDKLLPSFTLLNKITTWINSNGHVKKHRLSWTAFCLDSLIIILSLPAFGMEQTLTTSAGFNNNSSLFTNSGANEYCTGASALSGRSQLHLLCQKEPFPRSIFPSDRKIIGQANGRCFKPS